MSFVKSCQTVCTLQIQCRHFIPALNELATQDRKARLPPSFLGMDAWMTSQLKVALICKLHRSSVCLAYFSDTLSMDVCATRHWQTSGGAGIKCLYCMRGLVYTALIRSAKNFALQPCWRVFVLLSICALKHSNLTRYNAKYLFQGCYFGAIMTCEN